MAVRRRTGVYARGVDWKEFIASLADSVAWPLGVVAGVWLLRRQLADLLAAPLTRLRAGPVELEWSRAAEEVGERVAALDALPATATEDPQTDRMAEVAETMPVVAVLSGWSLVECKLREIARRAESLGSVFPPRRRDRLPASALAEILARQELISQETAVAVRGLSTLRNLAAHDQGSGTSVTVERAREYVALVQAVLFALDGAMPKP